jgi:hypothetical protein
MQMDMARQLGGALGRLLFESLRSQPQQQPQQAVPDPQQQALMRQATEGEERRKEATRQRLLSMMRSADGELAPQPSSPPARLGFRFDEASFSSNLAQVPPNSAIAQLTRAAYFSEQAGKVSADEEVAALAEAAFNSALGVPVDLPVPRDIVVLEVSDNDAAALDARRKAYREESGRAADAATRVAEGEERRQLAEKLAAEALTRVRDAEAKLAKARSAEEQRMRRAELSEARATLAEAQAFREQAERQGAAARAELDRSYSSIQLSADRLTAFAVAGRRDDPYTRGILDGATCMLASTQIVCASAANVPLCTDKYMIGYRVGERAKENKLREAHAIGEQAKERGNSFLGFDHPKSSGPCRIPWLKAFYTGYGGYPLTMIGR